MQLRELTLQQFRSYSKRTFLFTKNTTVFLGPNAIGKTNILEAIYLLSTGKSFRADRDSEMIHWSEEVGRVSGKISNRKSNDDYVSLDSSKENNASSFPFTKMGNGEVEDEINLEVVLTAGLVMGQKTQIKKLLVNNIPRRQYDFAAQLKTVLFEPEDLDLVRGSPGLRRRYLDQVLSQIDREYRRSLFSYEKGIRQRNRLLEKIRDGEASRNQLFFWDQLLIKNGSCIMQKREDLIAHLNFAPKPFGNFQVVYDQSVISEARLKQYEQEEVAAAMTLVGPHRDDLKFLENKRDMSKYASRGEQRLVVLWLKLAELDFVEEQVGTRPLLLLDDIFSELDHGHREEVLRVVDKQQTIITTADQHFLPESLQEVSEVVKLTNIYADAEGTFTN